MYLPNSQVNPANLHNPRLGNVMPQSVETVNVAVHVTDDDDQPINGVEVSMCGSTGTTGSQGGCTLHDVPVGECSITATKAGYDEYSESIEITDETESIEIILQSQER